MYGSVCIRAGAHLISAKTETRFIHKHSRVIQTISCIEIHGSRVNFSSGKPIETHIEFILSRYPSPNDATHKHTQHINIQQTEWGFIEFFRLTRPVIRRDYWWLCLVSLLMPGALCRVPHHTTRPVLNYNYAIAAHTHIVARLCSRWLLIGHCFSVHFFVFHLYVLRAGYHCGYNYGYIQNWASELMSPLNIWICVARRLVSLWRGFWAGAGSQTNQ